MSSVALCFIPVEYVAETKPIRFLDPLRSPSLPVFPPNQRSSTFTITSTVRIDKSRSILTPPQRTYRLERDAALFKLAQSTVVRDPVHARAVVSGLFGEAVRIARHRAHQQGMPFDDTPWRRAYHEAMEELMCDDLPVREILNNVIGQINSLRLFSPSILTPVSYPFS